MGLRILWINEEARPFGGCETYIHNLASALEERGVESYLLYSTRTRPDRRWLAPFRGAFPLVAPHEQIEAFGADVIFVNRWSGAETLEAAAATGIPVVRMFHDHTHFCLRGHGMTAVRGLPCDGPLGFGCLLCPGFIGRSPSADSGRRSLRWNSLSKKLGELAANRRLHRFLTASDYMRRKLVAHGFDASRIETIPLFVRPPRIDPAEVKKDPALVVYAGQLIRGKGVDVLLDAAAAVERPFSLEIIGDGYMREALETKARKLGLEKRVRFRGRMDQETLHAAYARACFVVMPSRAPETFGLVGPEAMSCGTAVIASSHGAVPEWLDDGVNGIGVPPCDAGALAAAMERLLSDPAEAQRMGREGRKRYEERFTLDGYVGAFLDFMEGTANEMGGDGRREEVA